MKKIAILAVVALQDQRYRIGRGFSREVTEIPLDELDEDQVEALKADPLLSVTETERDVEADAADADAEKPKASTRK